MLFEFITVQKLVSEFDVVLALNTHGDPQTNALVNAIASTRRIAPGVEQQRLLGRLRNDGGTGDRVIGGSIEAATAGTILEISSSSSERRGPVLVLGTLTTTNRMT